MHRLVGGEDHRPFAQMPIIDHVVEHVGGLRAVREIAHLVNHQDMRVRVAIERLVQAALPTRIGQILDQLGGGGEERVEAVLDRAVRDGDRQVRLPAAGFAVQNQRAAVGHEIGREIRAQQRQAQLGLQREVEILDRLEVGKVRAACESLQAGLRAVRDFLRDQEREKISIGPLFRLGAGDRLGMDVAHVREMEPL